MVSASQRSWVKARSSWLCGQVWGLVAGECSAAPSRPSQGGVGEFLLVRGRKGEAPSPLEVRTEISWAAEQLVLGEWEEARVVRGEVGKGCGRSPEGSSWLGCGAGAALEVETENLSLMMRGVERAGVMRLEKLPPGASRAGQGSKIGRCTQVEGDGDPGHQVNRCRCPSQWAGHGAARTGVHCEQVKAVGVIRSGL